MVLTAAVKRILLLGLDFGLPIKKINFSNYYLIVEKLLLLVQNFSIYECIPNAKQTFKYLLKTIAHKCFHDFKPMNNLFSIFT